MSVTRRQSDDVIGNNRGCLSGYTHLVFNCAIHNSALYEYSHALGSEKNLIKLHHAFFYIFSIYLADIGIDALPQVGPEDCDVVPLGFNLMLVTVARLEALVGGQGEDHDWIGLRTADLRIDSHSAE